MSVNITCLVQPTDVTDHFLLLLESQIVQEVSLFTFTAYEESNMTLDFSGGQKQLKRVTLFVHRHLFVIFLCRASLILLFLKSPVKINEATFLLLNIVYKKVCPFPSSSFTTDCFNALKTRLLLINVQYRIKLFIMNKYYQES